MPLLRAENFTVSTGAAIDIYFLLLAGVLQFSENLLPFRLNTSCREPLLQKKCSRPNVQSVLISSYRDLLPKKPKPLSLLFSQLFKSTLLRPNVRDRMSSSYCLLPIATCCRKNPSHRLCCKHNFSSTTAAKTLAI